MALITITNDSDHREMALVAAGTATAFEYVHVDDPFTSTWDSSYGGGNGILTITLRSPAGPLGTLVDPGAKIGPIATTVDPTSNTLTYTQKTFGGPQSSGAAAFPDEILDRIVYTAPSVPAGQIQDVVATVSYTGTTLASGGTFPTPSVLGPATATDQDALTFHLQGPTPPPEALNFYVQNARTSQSLTLTGDAYGGTFGGLEHQLIFLTPDNLAVSAAKPNAFIVTGSGNDSIDVSATGGTNVLDGRAGSNFLVGGAGQDTFFVDGRDSTSSTWSTVANFGAGDSATLWGMTPGDFTFQWSDGLGAPGATGLTLAATGDGKPNVNLTLAGYTGADLSNGRLGIVFGATPASGDTAGVPYLYIAAI